ncbi:hypothetical protein CLOM_g14812 [Closterium sp. NIES-68]|nr:hypothetical protein CLOM_g14812 [Closterium sp. NIES-68]GJP71226.1 hypothetical protein CLOP_g2081 [Closterium sp. NIES-67]
MERSETGEEKEENREEDEEDEEDEEETHRQSGGGEQWREKAVELERMVRGLQEKVKGLEQAVEKERKERLAERRGRIRAEQELRNLRVQSSGANLARCCAMCANFAAPAEQQQQEERNLRMQSSAEQSSAEQRSAEQSSAELIPRARSHGRSGASAAGAPQEPAEASAISGVPEREAGGQSEGEGPSDGLDVTEIQNEHEFAQEQLGHHRQQQQQQQQHDTSERLTTYPMTPIGVLRSCFSARNGTPRQPLLVPAARAYLELPRGGVAPAALQGLEGYSHCWLLYVFHANTDIQRLWSDPLHSNFRAKVRVPRLQGGKLGALATRTPHRPVPIGLSIAKPVLDIKPYLPYSDAVPSATVPRWVEPSGDDDGMHMASVTFHPAVSTQLQHAWSAQSHRSIYSHPNELQQLCQQVLSRDIRSVSQRQQSTSLTSVTPTYSAHGDGAAKGEWIISKGGCGKDSLEQKAVSGSVLYHVMLDGIDFSYAVTGGNHVTVLEAHLASR